MQRHFIAIIFPNRIQTTGNHLFSIIIDTIILKLIWRFKT